MFTQFPSLWNSVRWSVETAIFPVNKKTHVTCHSYCNSLKTSEPKTHLAHPGFETKTTSLTSSYPKQFCWPLSIDMHLTGLSIRLSSTLPCSVQGCWQPSTIKWKGPSQPPGAVVLSAVVSLRANLIRAIFIYQLKVTQWHKKSLEAMVSDNTEGIREHDEHVHLLSLSQLFEI